MGAGLKQTQPSVRLEFWCFLVHQRSFSAIYANCCFFVWKDEWEKNSDQFSFQSIESEILSYACKICLGRAPSWSRIFTALVQRDYGKPPSLSLQVQNADSCKCWIPLESPVLSEFFIQKLFWVPKMIVYLQEWSSRCFSHHLSVVSVHAPVEFFNFWPINLLVFLKPLQMMEASGIIT